MVCTGGGSRDVQYVSPCLKRSWSRAGFVCVKLLEAIPHMPLPRCKGEVPTYEAALTESLDDDQQSDSE